MQRKWSVCVVFLLLITLGGCSSGVFSKAKNDWNNMLNGSTSQKVLPEEDLLEDELGPKVKVKLYFARRDGEGLGVEEREISKVEGIARATLQELIKGPLRSDLVSPLPKGIKLLDINIKPDGTCILDFNARLTEVAGAKEETLAVYSIVNTVSQFASVERVVFLIEGKKINSIGGNINVAEPVTADYTLGEE